MDLVDAIKVEVSGTGVIIPKKEVKKCDNSCGFQLPNADDEIERDNEQ